MITFNRTVIGTQYAWTDADGNQLELNLEQFNLLKAAVTYEGREVWLKASFNEPTSVLIDAPTTGLQLSMYMVDYPAFSAEAQSISFKDAEFVRLIKGRAVRILANPRSVYVK